MIENALQPIEQAEVIALGLAYSVNGTTWKQIAKRAAGELPVNAAEDLKEILSEAGTLRTYGDAILQLLHMREFAARLESADVPLPVEVVITGTATNEADASALLEIVRLAEGGRLKVHVLIEPPDGRSQPNEPFVLLSFAHKQHNDVVFAGRSQSYIEDPVACRLISQSFETLRHSGLGSQESINFIAELADGGHR